MPSRSTQRSVLQDYLRHFSETVHLSLPVIIGQLGFVLMGVIDNLMIGRIGYNYLSAASLANSAFFIISVIGIGITFAVSPLVAEARGAGKPKRAGLYLRQGVWVGIFSSLLISLALYFTAELLPYLDQPPEDVVLAYSYLNILNLSVLPFMLFMVYKQFADGLAFTLPAMVITLIGLAFNVWANWLLIFGNWGFPRMELDGGGYATLASRILMFILMAAYIMIARRFRQYQPFFRWREFSSSAIRKIIDIGLPSGLQYFFEVGAFGGAVFMIGWIGMVERSAHQIVISLASVTYMIVSGLSAGTAIRVGNGFGKKDFLYVQRAGFSGMILGGIFMLFVAGMFIVGKDILPTIFLDASDPARDRVMLIAAELMLIAAWFSFFDGVQAVGIGALRGMQDVRIPTLIAFVAYWLIALPVGYWLAFPLEMGVEGMWYGFVVSLIFAAVMLTWRFQSLTRRRIRDGESSQSTGLDIAPEVLT